MTARSMPLGELIEPARVERANGRLMPILSMTMHSGLVDQELKFRKRIASADTSQYKVVNRNQLVVGFPIDEGVLSFQGLYDRAIVSPAYNIWNITGNVEIEPSYLERFLRSPRALAYYRSKLRGTTARRRTLPDEIFLSMPVIVPSVAVQRHIMNVLEHAEGLQIKRHKTLARLGELTQSIFRDMFGGPTSGGDNWTQSKLRDIVFEFRYGTSNKSQPQGLPALRIPNVTNSEIDASDLKLVPVSPSERERLRLLEGDLLFVRTNGNPDLVGRCAIYNRDVAAKSGRRGEDFIYASYLIRARPKKDVISPVYLREFMLGPAGRRALRSRSKTSAGQFNINTESLGAIEVPVPPLDLQQEYARRVEAIVKLRTSHRAHLAELDALFVSLQYRAFRGEL